MYLNIKEYLINNKKKVEKHVIIKNRVGSV